MHDKAARGQLLVFSETEARKAYPNIVIASLGAQRKEKPGGKVTTPVLFDGTHGLCVNTRTRLRDQERAPIAADLKRTTREKAKLDELTFALSADVSEAHRQAPIHPDDWHLLGCQVISGREVFINTGGTLSIASASYYWSRVAGAVGRLAQYLIGDSATTWHMLVADDNLLECGGPAYRRGLLTFFENLFCVLSLEFLYPGTRRPVAMYLSGWDLSSFHVPGVLASRRDVPNGLYAEHRRLQIRTR